MLVNSLSINCFKKAINRICTLFMENVFFLFILENIIHSLCQYLQTCAIHMGSCGRHVTWSNLFIYFYLYQRNTIISQNGSYLPVFNSILQHLFSYPTDCWRTFRCVCVCYPPLPICTKPIMMMRPRASSLAAAKASWTLVAAFTLQQLIAVNNTMGREGGRKRTTGTYFQSFTTEAQRKLT